MIPCPDCRHLCGIRDVMLLGEDLCYRCAHCLTFFKVNLEVPLASLVGSDDEVRDEDIFDLSDNDDVTPLVPPPHLASIVLDELRLRPIPVEVTPPLGVLVSDTLARNPSFVELPPRGSRALAAPLLPREDRTTRRERRTPLPPSDSSPPSPRRPTPLTFGPTIELTPTPTPTPTPTASIRPRIVVAARHAVQGVVAASAVVGLAAAFAFVATHGALEHSSHHSLAAGAPFAEPPPPVTPKDFAPSIVMPAVTPKDPAPAVVVPDIAPVAVAALPPAKPRPPRADGPHLPTPARPPLTEAEALVAAGDRSYRAGHLDRAAELYEHALSVSPAFVPARLGAAATDWERGRHAEARARYQALASDAPEAIPASLRDRTR